MRGLKSFVMVAVLVACGCSGDKTTAPGESMSGSFTLRTLNGSPLPGLLIQDPTGKLEVTAGTLNFNADKTWSGTVTARFTSVGGGTTTQTIAGNGTYLLHGSDIVVHDNTNGRDYNGTVNGNALTASMQLIPGIVTETVWQK